MVKQMKFLHALLVQRLTLNCSRTHRHHKLHARIARGNNLFTTTAEIHARSLANFYGQYADRHKFEIHATRQRARAGNWTICYRKKN